MSLSVDPVLAIDIGGTSLRLGLINIKGELIGDISRYDVPFAADGAADLPALLAFIAGHIDPARQIACFGIGVLPLTQGVLVYVGDVYTPMLISKGAVGDVCVHSFNQHGKSWKRP